MAFVNIPQIFNSIHSSDRRPSDFWENQEREPKNETFSRTHSDIPPRWIALFSPDCHGGMGPVDSANRRDGEGSKWSCFAWSRNHSNADRHGREADRTNR